MLLNAEIHPFARIAHVFFVQINIYDCSVITPYALLFFGGEISLSMDEEQEIVTVDDWIKFNCRQSVATLVQVFFSRTCLSMLG
jgi:hypothetical protein